MVMKKNYTLSFFITLLMITGTLFGLVTYTNPFQITNAPWSIDFISDRNMSYKKFLLLKDNTGYTDLIIGSSTSEVLVPEMIQKLYGVKSFLAGTGGSKTPFRLAQIQFAIKNNPNLKKIIYVSDLFEFTNSDLDTKTFYQDEIMDEIPQSLRSKLLKPDLISRVQDYFSEPTLQATFKTLSDYRKFKKGEYQSQFRNDGSTEKSMVVIDSKESIDSRVMRIAKAYESQYRNFQGLDDTSKEFLNEIIKIVLEKNIELNIVIAPWHTKFYEHFKNDLVEKSNTYSAWVSHIKSLEKPSLRVIDFSYPVSQGKGVLDSSEYWHDGVHFSHKSAEIILNEIYKK